MRRKHFGGKNHSKERSADLDRAAIRNSGGGFVGFNKRKAAFRIYSE